jgi:glutathione S-transferase
MQYLAISSTVAMNGALGVMERHLSDREFFVGDSPTVADVALYVYPRVCPEGGYDLEGFPAVRAWLTI